MVVEKYNLNEETLKFIIDFEKSVGKGKTYSNRELVMLFESSSYYNDVIKTYYKTATQKSIWWAVKRSNSWLMERGRYTKLF
jgi:predicted Ser/Thr protein kinase